MAAAAAPFAAECLKTGRESLPVAAFSSSCPVVPGELK